MRFRPMLASALLAVFVLALSGTASRLSAQPSAAAFSPAQRAEIVAILRDALKRDPSILRDAVIALRADEEQAQASDSEAAVRRNKAALAAQPGDYVAGDPSGDVTLVEFYDPRCPYCRRALKDVDTLLGGDRHLRLVEKLIPILGPQSLLEARAIEAAGRQGHYATMQRSLMEGSASLDPPELRALAGRIGLDLARFDRDMADPALRAGLHETVDLAQSLGITGTPSFVVGGKLIVGAVGIDELRKAVREARPG